VPCHPVIWCRIIFRESTGYGKIVKHLKGVSLPTLLVALSLLVLLVPAWNSYAFAQARDPRQEARLHFGIFHLSPAISITDVGVDSNVYNAADEPKSDFTFSVTPRSTIWVPYRKRALLTADVGVGFLYYKDARNQRSTSPSVNLQGELYARRITLSVQSGWSSTFRQPTVEIEQRVRNNTENLGAGVKFTVGRGLSVGTAVYRQTLSFDDGTVFQGSDLRTELNRREQGVRLAVLEQVTSLTTVGLVAETRQERFEFSPDRDADGYRVAATFALAEKAVVAGTAEVGFRHVKPNDPKVPAFDGLVARVGLTNRLPGSFQTGIGWDRDMHYSFSGEEPYYLSNALSARLSRQIGGSFNASFTAGRNQASYRAPLDSALVAGRRETTKSYTVDVGYAFRRNTTMGVAVTRNRRTTESSTDRQFNNTRAGAYLNYVF